jgi:hypothetical protein
MVAIKTTLRWIAPVIFVLASVLEISAQTETHGLVLRGIVTHTSRVRPMPRYLDVKINLNLTFMNTGAEPIILLRPWQDGGFWHGASSLARSIDDANANRRYFSDSAWASNSLDDGYRKLANDLDQPSPPSSFTMILKSGESWNWQTTVTLRFEDNPKSYNVPWEEMKNLASPLWLRVSFEMWPFNVEHFKPNLAAKLQKLWRRFGYLWIGDSFGRIHLARLTSEPIELDWKTASTQ